MRALVLNLNGFYYRYLPILSHLDYLTGVSLSGVYNYFGKVVTEEESKINELYYIKLGPENGFSFNIRDLFELRSVLSLYAGIPVSGMIYYPGGNEESVSPVTLGIKINTELSFNIKKIFLSLSYQWFDDYLLLLEGESSSFVPQAINSESAHSIALTVGIRL